MTYKGHTVGGLVAAALTVQATGAKGIVTLACLLGVCLLGCLVPDLDQMNSKISHKLWLLSAMYVLFRWTVSNPVTWFIYGEADDGFWRRFATGRRRLNDVVKHRGMTHTIISALMYAFAVMLIALALIAVAIFKGWPTGWILANDTWLGFGGSVRREAQAVGVLFIGAVLSYVSHLLLDMPTVRGVAIFYPWSDHKFALGPLRLRRWVTDSMRWGD